MSSRPGNRTPAPGRPFEPTSLRKPRPAAQLQRWAKGLIVLCLIFSAGASVVHSALDENSGTPVEYIKMDYDHVDVVAHVKIEGAREIDFMGNEKTGYSLILVQSRVIEVLKGNMKEAGRLEYVMSRETPHDPKNDAGDKIIFLTRSYDAVKKQWRFDELENSELRCTEPLLMEIRAFKKDAP